MTISRAIPYRCVKLSCLEYYHRKGYWPILNPITKLISTIVKLILIGPLINIVPGDSIYFFVYEADVLLSSPCGRKFVDYVAIVRMSITVYTVQTKLTCSLLFLPQQSSPPVPFASSAHSEFPQRSLSRRFLPRCPCFAR